ncbi:MAG: Hsp70 family protein [Myxococcota bacterium]|nr:Hsp70 family protein [Myxococcota bacterium]
MIIGIDLGTTNSAAAYVDHDGRPRLVRAAGGSHTLPSIFAIDDKGREVVGFEARRQWQLNPHHTVYGAKRLIGRQFDEDFIESLRKYFTYELVEGTGGAVEVVLQNKQYTLADISAKLLGAIRDLAEEHLQQKVTEAVVTVPAYYDDLQRQSVKAAGHQVGMEINRIINEPTAAALAYGYGRQLSERVVVFDLGGGTFDVSVIEIRDNVFEVVATDGDLFLGGINFDQIILNEILTSFHSEYGVDLTSEPATLQRLRDIAEQCKVDLSDRTEVEISVPFVAFSEAGDPLDINMKITRARFEELTKELVDRTVEVCAGVLEAAELKPDQIDEVLLVGGQSRMPAISAACERYFGKPPSKGVHPDEAVALGAAIFASALQGESGAGQSDVTLLDVIPMAIGIEGANGRMFRIFSKNAPTPNSRRLTFTTSYDGQKELVMRIFQGDHAKAGENQFLGEHVFDGLRPGKAGQVRVETTFDLSVDGILSLHARDLDTQKAVRHSLRISEAAFV